MTIDIRKLGPEEIEDKLKPIVELDSKFFPWPWKEEDWESVRTDLSFSLILYEENQRIIGFALFKNNTYSKENYLIKILVDPAHRKGGVAFDIFNYAKSLFVAEGYTNCFLEVSTKNTSALNFYLKLGFMQLTQKRKFYSNGEDAYAMQLVYE